MRRDLSLAIIGGGFGLYGYLPAVADACPDAKIFMDERHRTKLESREDVKFLSNRVKWKTEEALLSDTNAVIIAVPPENQAVWVERVLNENSITHLLLEKPVAVTPDLSRKIQHALIESEKSFRIGYNFRYTNWGQALLAERKGVESIEWRFKAHHFTNDAQNWKKWHAEGGGALRFYGIHIIALLAELGYKDVARSLLSADSARWEAQFIGPDLTPCSVLVSSNDETDRFSVNGQSRSLFDRAQAQADSRIPYLKKLLNEWLNDNAKSRSWYESTLTLWRLAEEKNA